MINILTLENLQKIYPYLEIEVNLKEHLQKMIIQVKTFI